MASKSAALGLVGLFVVFLAILVVVQFLKPYRREGFSHSALHPKEHKKHKEYKKQRMHKGDRD